MLKIHQIFIVKFLFLFVGTLLITSLISYVALKVIIIDHSKNNLQNAISLIGLELQKIDDLLSKYGSDKKSLLSVTIYLRDIKDFAAMNEVWDNWAEAGHEPARACVEARMAREDLLVEMTVTAAVI